MTQLLENGELKPIGTIAKQITGQRPSRPTIWRWLRKGVAGGVTLDAVSVFNTWHTTEAAFRDFLRRRSEAMLRPQDKTPQPNEDELNGNELL